MDSEKVSIENGILVTMDEQVGILERGHLLVQGDKVFGVTSSDEVLRSFKAERRIDASRRIVLPGLANTHMHTRPMRVFGDGLSLKDWHGRYPDNFSKELTSDEAFLSAQLAFVECLRSGETSVISMAVHTNSDLRAADAVGIRARIMPMSERDDEVERNIRDIESSKGKGIGSRVSLWLGLEFPTIFSDSTLRTVREVSDRTGAWVHAHLSENVRDDARRLENLGFLNHKMVFAHCVQVTKEDIEILAKHDVKVAHAPRSNMKYGNGIAPVLSMIKSGVKVAIATDGGLNTVGREDIFEEMRIATMVHRGVKSDASILKAGEVLRMCTLNGSMALGLQNCGRLRKGAKADVVILDAERNHFSPLIVSGKDSNIIPAIIFGASSDDVETVMVDGRLVVRKGKILNVNEIPLRKKVQKIAERILSKLP